MPLQQTIFAKPLSEPLQKVIRHNAKMTVNSMGALTTLALNGYGNDAMKIARGMLEAAIKWQSGPIRSGTMRVQKAVLQA